MTMDEATRAAVHAFYRLYKTTQSLLNTEHQPTHTEATRSLYEAAREANAKMQAAGLLQVNESDFEALVRQVYPDVRICGA
ncbi:hypothetical protein [Streptomyces nanshensis]|nr:hypothetical protein [Streptomyces nanshensis]